MSQQEQSFPTEVPLNHNNVFLNFWWICMWKLVFSNKHSSHAPVLKKNKKEKKKQTKKAKHHFPHYIKQKEEKKRNDETK